MATIDLGKIKFNWRGTYAGGTAYVPDDVVYYVDGSVGSSYMCVANTTGNAPSSGGTLHASWEYLAKGQATSPTTTQGDIIVRGASADQRLAIGTAGQALKVNSSANGLEYGSAAGMTKLYEYSNTGGTAVNSFTVDGYFDDSKYMHYRAIVSDVYTAANGNANNPSMRFNVSGSPVTSSNYAWSFNEAYASGTHERGNGNSNYTASITQMQGTWACRSNTYELQNFDIVFFNPTTTGLGAKFVKWTGHCFQEGNSGDLYCMSSVATGLLKTTSALTGFQIYSADGSNFTYKITLYGILK